MSFKNIFLFFLPLIQISYAKTSLSFVIDDTYSMSDDIAQVIRSSSAVFDAVLHSNSSQVEDFLLITFNDPVSGRLRVRTKDRDEFKRHLQAVTPHGGGDCAELAMSGIELALKESLPGSQIYVSTDASAKDANQLEAVRYLATKKQTRIDFLLTGKCYDGSGDDYSSFYKVAQATSGQVFHIHKQNVEQILKYVIESVKSPKTVVASAELPPGYNHHLNFTIDDGMNEILVSVTGDNPKIQSVIGPDGTPVKSEIVVNLPNVLIIRGPDIKPGVYTVDVGASSNAALVVYAATSVLFNHGFLAYEPSSISDTAPQPVSGVMSHLAIELVTTRPHAVLDEIQVIDMDGNMFSEKPLKLVDKNKKLYVTEKFLPPNSIFKIVVKGHDTQSKAPFKRTSLTGIEPQKPTLEASVNKAPIVKVSNDLIRLEYDQPLKVLCKVNGFPKPDTIWVDEDGKAIKSTESIVAAPYDYVNILEIDKVKENNVYTCKATNAFGNHFEVVKVEVQKELPKINKTTIVVKAKKGENAQIDCSIYEGKPTPKMHWTVQHEGSEKEELPDSSQTIMLKNVTLKTAGTFTCLAVNELGQDNHTVFLIVEYPPIIKESEELVSSVQGRPTKLPCEVEGIPKPRVDWYLDGAKILSDRTHHIYRDNTLRFTGSPYDKGIYMCVAANAHGSVNKTIYVNYALPVSLRPPYQSTFIMKLRDDLELPCLAEGIPKPTIKWLHYTYDKKSIPDEKKDVDMFGSLHLNHLESSNEGYYVCVASNEMSSANMTYEVKVYVPPSIEVGQRAYTSYLGNKLTRMPCKAIGNPKPEITWTRDGKNIAAGTEWFDILDDGSLIIKNVDKSFEGSYVCHAKNELSQDLKQFKLHVKAYPEEKDTDKTIKLEQGDTKMIECDIPHTKLDSLSWFKNTKLIKKGELIIRAAKLSDAGTYTCIVQYFDSDLNSKVNSVKVVVGSKPAFLIPDYVSLIRFEPYASTYLDCLALGEPEPEVTWYFEDKEIEFNDMYYGVQMTFDKRGNYKCVVSNSFGSISRSFVIATKDCILNINKDFGAKQPLMLESHELWPLFESDSGFLRIPYGEQNLLYCPSGFVNFPYRQVTASCEQESQFKINDKTYEYSELNCLEEVELTTRKTGRKCLHEGTEEFKVGYMASRRFVEAFEICLDKDKKAPIYAKHRLQRSLADVELETGNWKKDDSLPLNFDKMYDCDSQVEGVSVAIGRWFHGEDKCCFRKRQLVSSRNLPPGLAQKAAYSYLNVVPQWSTCNSKNWDELEKRVRRLVKETNQLLVWTGAYGEATIHDSFGIPRKISLQGESHQEQAIPEYIWKLIQDPSIESSIAIVQVNIPDLTDAEGRNHVRCTDICDRIPWLQGHKWRKATDGYTFCCSLSQFEKAFQYEGVFGPGNKNVLYGDYGLSSRFL